MRFVVQPLKAPSFTPRLYPLCILQEDRWDDFGYQIQFRLSYYAKAAEAISIGDLKILQKGKKKTVLPRTFRQLSPDYVSLGQDVDFYARLVHLLGRQTTFDVLA